MRAPPPDGLLFAPAPRAARSAASSPPRAPAHCTHRARDRRWASPGSSREVAATAASTPASWRSRGSRAPSSLAVTSGS